MSFQGVLSAQIIERLAKLRVLHEALLQILQLRHRVTCLILPPAVIFRAVDNSVFVGDDGATPAMRLGFKKHPLRFEDILWPGQRVPRPKRVRRRGKRLAVA